jgi:hypothetical protein
VCRHPPAFRPLALNQEAPCSARGGFTEPPELIDGELKLELIQKVQANHENGFLPVYRFKMVNTINGIEMGGINFRVGYTDNVRFFRGNIGFTVYEDFRGNHFALRR